VDRYVPLLSTCLCDSNELVRRHAVALLTKLLAEDYIKWKGVLLYRFLGALADPSATVAEFGTVPICALTRTSRGITAKFCLLETLHRKSPLLFFNHTLEALFYFNDCTSHPLYNKFAQSERERAVFCFPGKANQKCVERLLA
jgi:condensin-2 complex subunit D3